jgi:hypothetical protein
MKTTLFFLPALLLVPLALLAAEPIPLIDVTDLYHPPQDAGDNFDLLAAYGLLELDLRAVILDVTETLRTDRRGLTEAMIREGRGRDAGFIPVLQLNAIFDRDVPCATTPYQPMKSVGDKMLDAPRFQQQGVELILKTLRDSPTAVHIVSFGSARAIAAAYNREPELLRKKVACLHLCAGQSSPPIPNYREHNVALDPLSIVCLLRSDLPIALYPDASKNLPAGSPPDTPAYMAGYGYDEHNTFYNLPNRRFITKMDPPLRRYLEYAFSQSTRPDFLRMTELDGPPLEQSILDCRHDIWETAVWIIVSGRKLVKRADGACRIIPAAEVVATDKVLPNELRPCTVTVQDNGIYEFRETTKPTNFSVYYRGDPRENEAALREALPALYLSFRSNTSKN